MVTISDGSVVIEIELDATKAKGQYNNFGKEIADDLGKVDSASKKASTSIATIAKSIGLVKIASAVFNSLKSSMDAAISRFDTFQRFPKVMSALGFSAQDSDRAIRQLSTGIEGLPTKLDDVVSTTQRMTAMTGNLNKSTQATLALNNAFLASGASASDAQRGTEQYIQQLAKGEVDMQSWRTLQESMSVGLQKVAEDMGFVGDAATTDLYGALKSGEVTFREFQESLIKLGTGTGELANLAKINSEGIATSFTNLKTAMSKGLANVIEALDRVSVAVTGSNIAQNIDNMKVIINKAFEVIVTAIQKTEPVIQLLVTGFQGTLSVARTLSPVLIGLAAAYAALQIIQKVSSFSREHADLLLRAVESGKNLTLVTNAQMSAEVAKTGVQKAGMVVTAANNGLIKVSTLLYGVLTGSISASAAATTVMTAVTTAFGTAIQVLLGPVGWIVAGIGLLTAGAVALFKWWNKDTEASKKLNAEQEKLISSTEELANATEQSAAARQDELNHIESSKAAYQTLAEEVSNLAEKENLSAGEKKNLKDQVEQLNTAYADLNLQYDDETGKLSMTNEQLQERIALYQEQEKANEAQQQLVDILTEQNEIGMKIEEVKNKREEWNAALEDGSVKSKEAKEAIAELDEQETSLQETLTALGDEHERVSQVQIEASEAVASAIENGAQQQIITYESLTDAQKSAVDAMRETYQTLADSATNAFDQISTDSEISLSQMVDNMQHNQDAVQQWGENQAALLAWAGQNGYENFIPFIENMGIDQAGVLNEMVQGVDGTNAEQAALLSELAETYTEGFGTAADAGKTALSDGLEGLPEEITNMVITPVQGINEQVKTEFATMGQNIGEGVEQGVNDSSENVSTAVETLADHAQKAFSGPLGIHSPSTVFADFGRNIVEGLVNGIGEGNGLIQSAMNVLVNNIKTSMNNINTSSKVSMSGFVNSITNAMSRANVAVQNGNNRMMQSTAAFNSQLSSQSTSGMARYAQTIQSGMSRATSAVINGTNQMKLAFTTYQNQLNTQSTASMNRFAQTTTNGMNKAVTAVNSGVNRMKTQFSSMNAMIASQTRTAMNSFVSAINSGMNRGVSATSSGRSRMASAMSSLRSSFYSAGYNASLGVASGIYAGSGSAMAAANSLASRITATLRSAMKIKSPSRVMRDEIGRYIPEGVAVGIDQYASEVDKSMDNIAKSVSDGGRFKNLKNVIPRINGLMSGTISPETIIGRNEPLLVNVDGNYNGNRKESSSNQTYNTDNRPYIHIDKIENYTDSDVVDTLEQAAWIMNRDGRRLSNA